MRELIMLLAVICLLASCSQSDNLNVEECTPVKMDCLNYDISFDTLFLTYLKVKVDGVSYSRNTNSPGGAQNLLGAIGFDGDKCNFFFHARYVDSIYLEYKYTGSFDYTYESLAKNTLMEDSYTKYGKLNIYDTDSGDSLTNITHRFNCGTGSYRFEFVKDSVEYFALFE